MRFAVDIALIFTVLLVSVRLAAFLLLTPLFAVGNVPVRIRILLIAGLSLTLALALSPAQPAHALTSGYVIQAIVSEALIGALMAFGLFAAFGAFLFGGRVIDFQMGFGVATLIDPATEVQAPMTGTLLHMTAVVTFFLVDGHLLLMRAFADSLTQLPPGEPLVAAGAGPLVAQFGVMFVYGVAVVAPVMIALLMLDVGLAVAARTMPQVNMFILGIPMKILVGLAVLAASLRFMAPLLHRIYATIFDYLDALVS